MSASSFSDRCSASSGFVRSSSDFALVAVIWDSQTSSRGVRTGYLSIFEFLEAVSKLITRNAQKFGGAGLIPTASLYCLPNKRQLGFVERDAFIRQNKQRRTVTGSC